MDFVDALPLASCTSGGRDIRMISNTTLADDIVPIFQVLVSGSHRPDLDQFLVQPTRDKYSPGSVLKFSAPPQPRFGELDYGGERVQIKLTATDGTGRASSCSWDFEYSKHGVGGGAGQHGYQGAGGQQWGCMFCLGLVD